MKLIIEVHVHHHADEELREVLLQRLDQLERTIMTQSLSLAEAIAALQAQNVVEGQAIQAGILAETAAFTRMEADLATLRAATTDPAQIAAIDSITDSLVTHVTNLTAVAAQAAGEDVPAAGTGTGGGTTTLAGTVTTLTADNTAVDAGLPVVLSSQTLNPAGAVPTGEVTFLDGDTALGTATLDGDGKATLSTTFVAGTHSVTVGYGGDAASESSVSSAVSIVVT